MERGCDSQATLPAIRKCLNAAGRRCRPRVKISFCLISAKDLLLLPLWVWGLHRRRALGRKTGKRKDSTPYDSRLRVPSLFPHAYEHTTFVLLTTTSSSSTFLVILERLLSTARPITRPRPGHCQCIEIYKQSNGTRIVVSNTHTRDQ